MRYQCRQSQPSGALFLLSWLFKVIEASSILFTGATIITFDADSSRTDTIFDSSLLVENDRVSRIYVGSIPASYPNGTQVIDATGKIISPGFIDTHHHLWQTAFKTIASNVTLSEYFQKYSANGPSIQSFTPEDKYLSQLMGCFELLNSGTTTVLDHAHGITSNETADMLLNAMLDSKIRGFYAVGIQDLQLDNFTVQDQLNKLISQSQDPRLENSATSLGLSYDVFEATPSETLQYLWQLVQAQNLSVVTTHYLGGPWGASNSPTLLNQHGWLNSSVPVVFSHASYLTSEDMTTLRSTNQYISTTPESEMHYGHGHPHVDLIQDQASLGIDTHFTYSADMVAQARIWLQTLRLRRFMPVLEDSKIPIHSPMSVEQAFYLITRAGGLALRREDLGVIKEGAKADLVVFDGESPGMFGWSDAVAAIILHSNVGDVEHVLVDGVFVKKDRKIVVEEYAGTKQRFLESKNRIQKIWRERDWGSWSEGKWSGVTEFGEVETIDTLRGDGTGY